MCTQDKKGHPIHSFDKGISPAFIFYVQVKQSEIPFVVQYDGKRRKMTNEMAKQLFFAPLIRVYQGADCTFQLFTSVFSLAAAAGFSFI